MDQFTTPYFNGTRYIFSQNHYFWYRLYVKFPWGTCTPETNCQSTWKCIVTIVGIFASFWPIFRVCKGLRLHLAWKMKELHGIANTAATLGVTSTGTRTSFLGCSNGSYFFLYKLPLNHQVMKKSTNTLLKINIFHLGNRKIIFKIPLGRDMLVPRREIQIPRIHSEDFHPTWNGIKCVTNWLLLSILFLKVSSTNYQLYSPPIMPQCTCVFLAPSSWKMSYVKPKKIVVTLPHLWKPS